MARLPTPPRPGVGARTALALSRRMFGKDLAPTRLLAHHRGVFWRTLWHEVGLMGMRHRLPTSLRDLVTHRVAIVIGCPWCIDFGAMLALKGGLTRERLLAVPEYADSALFSQLEKRVLAYADAVTATPPVVTDDQVARLRGDLGDAGLVELTFYVALENHRSRVNHALGVPSQGFTDAEVCLLPPCADPRL